MAEPLDPLTLRRLNVTQKRQALASMALVARPAKAPLRPVPAAIAATVAWIWDVSVLELIGQSREQRFVQPRTAAWALMRDLRPDLSTAHIGRAFERDEVTIRGGFQRHAKHLAKNPVYRDRYETARAAMERASRQGEGA